MATIEDRFNARSWCRLFFRNPEFFMPFMNPDAACSPSDPHASWEGVSSISVGIHASTIPPDGMDFHSPRVGRVIQWEPHGVERPITLAMYSAHPEHKIIPPCPGPAPERFNRWAEPTAVFTDGSRGRWDFRRYPQLWDSSRPWIAFAARAVRLDDPSRPEIWPTTSFFRWNNPTVSQNGGYWVHNLLRQLFHKRDAIEKDVYATYISVKDRIDVERYKDSLPYFDPLDLGHALRWTTWREGREWASRSAFYVAELTAFQTWMRHAERMVEERPFPRCIPLTAIPVPMDYMGTWAQGIDRTEDWCGLLLAGVPVYLLMAVPVGHPLERLAVRGSIDNDERYRHDAFDASLKRRNARLFHKNWKFSKKPEVYRSPTIYLPNIVSLPVSSEDRQMEPSTAWYRSFTSCIFLDHTVFRNFIPVTHSEQQLRLRERSAFAVLHPTERLLSHTIDPHPILRILPRDRDNGVTFFRELTDSKGHFWAQRLEGQREVEAVEYISSYMFEFASSRIVIYSNSPFPGRHRSICKYTNDLYTEDDVPDHSDRYYYTSEYKPGSNQEPTAIWRHDIQPPAFTEIVHIPRPSPYPIPTKLPRYASASSSISVATMVFEPWTIAKASIAIVMAPVKSTEDRPINATEGFEVFEIPDSDSAVQNVTLQRQAIKDQARRRFFWPKYGCQWESKEITTWTIPRNNVNCYPLRITNLSAETNFQEMWELIHTHTSIGDVLVASWYYEVDMTKTFNMGLRYEEDALCLWSTFSGIQYRNRLLDVYPVKAILGKCQLISNGHDSPRPTSRRLDVLRKVLEREHRIKASIQSLVDCAGGLFRSLTQNDDPLIKPPTAHDGPCFPAVVGGYVKPSSPYSYLHPPFVDVFGFTGQIGTNAHDDPHNGIHEDSSKGTGPVDTTENPCPPNKRKKKKYARLPAAYSRTDNEHRSNAKSLSPRLQYKLKKALECDAVHMTRCWKGLTLPPYVSHIHDPLVHFFEALWIWIDMCHDNLCKFRENGQLDYDYSSFEDAFSEMIYSRSLCGKDFADVFAARQAYENRSMHV